MKKLCRLAGLFLLVELVTFAPTILEPMDGLFLPLDKGRCPKGGGGDPLVAVRRIHHLVDINDRDGLHFNSASCSKLRATPAYPGSSLARETPKL